MSTEYLVSDEWFSRCYIDSGLPDDVLRQKLGERLSEMPLASHLVYQNEQQGNHVFDDFLWQYHGSIFQNSPAWLPRNGITYDAVRTSSYLENGTLLHVRQTTCPDVGFSDLRRYFVVTLDLLSNVITEWQVAKVETRQQHTDVVGDDRITQELFLTEGPFGLPIAEERHEGNLIDDVRAHKLGDALLRQTYAQLPRVILAPHQASLVRDGQIEKTMGDVRNLVRDTVLLARIQEKFGHLLSQQHESAATIAVA